MYIYNYTTCGLIQKISKRFQLINRQPKLIAACIVNLTLALKEHVQFIL